MGDRKRRTQPRHKKVPRVRPSNRENSGGLAHSNLFSKSDEELSLGKRIAAKEEGRMGEWFSDMI